MMKRLLNEAAIGDNSGPWDQKDIYLVSKPESSGGGGGGGGMPPPSADRPPIHWPDPIEMEADDVKSSGDQTPDDVNVITNPSELTDEERQSISKQMEEMAEKQDQHIAKDTSEDDPALSEEQLDILKKKLNELRKRARELEQYKNGGKSLGSGWGRVDEILTIHQGTIDWKQRLRKFFEPWISKKYQPTFAIPNRRDRVLYNKPPAIIRPGQQVIPASNKLHIFATIDTSGSIDDNMLASFLSELKGIFTQTVCQNANIEVRIIDWTGQVTNDKVLNQTNYKEFFRDARRTASGDNDFAAIKRYVIAKKYTPVAMVHFTDGLWHWDRNDIFTGTAGKPCKNIAVIPTGLESSIAMCKKMFGEDGVIPMTVYDTVRD